MSALWVFGYGSLIWNPGFDYKESKIGRISGYCRRFYQGSDTHRGSKHRMGRVVTLLEEEGVSTWGRAFQFTDEASTLAYLTNRESSLGGYSTVITQFYPRDPRDDPFPVLVYIALPCNQLFMGCASLDVIAKDIALSAGICGPNVEYLAKLTAFMRIHLPDESDDHLYRLEDLVRKQVSGGRQECDERLLKLFDEAMDDEINDLMQLKSVLSLADEEWLEDSANQSSPLSSGSSTRSGSMSSSVSSTEKEMMAAAGGSQWLSSAEPPKHTDRVKARKLRCINK